MNSVVMSIRGLPSLELWVLTLLEVPVSSGQNQMVLGGSGGSGGSGNSEIVGFDWSYQSRIRKWYFVSLGMVWDSLGIIWDSLEVIWTVLASWECY